jgi:hypothetical protein
MPPLEREAPTAHARLPELERDGERSSRVVPLEEMDRGRPRSTREGKRKRGRRGPPSPGPRATATTDVLQVGNDERERDRKMRWVGDLHGIGWPRGRYGPLPGCVVSR